MQDLKMADKITIGVWKMHDCKMTKCFSQLWTKLLGLKNDGPLFASYTSRKKDACLHDETVTNVARCLLGLPLLPAHYIVGALQNIRITIE